MREAPRMHDCIIIEKWGPTRIFSKMEGQLLLGPDKLP